VPGVSLKGLSRRYGDVAAVDDLSLEVKPGELVALLGPSGCGKTTTLRLVAGFLAPEAGEIWVGERCLSSPATVVPPERRRMAMIFQSYALWPHMTVAQNVAYGLRFKRGVAAADRDRRVAEMLRIVQLAGFEARYPGELSGGQQQRVAVARALVVEPEILLLDEPLSNLDANLREEMRFEIRRLHEAFGITTLYVTHDQAEAMVISDRIAVLERGRVAQVGTAVEIFLQPRTRFVAEFIGKTNLVEGVAVGPDNVALGPLRLRVGGERLVTGARVAVSIRPHDIALGGVPPAGANSLDGTIERASFLGDTVDYQVKVADSDVVLRVAAPAAQRRRAGERVGLSIDPAACIPLAANDDVPIPKRRDASILQRRGNIGAIVPNIVIADHRNCAIASLQRGKSCNAACDLLILGRRAFERMMVPVHIVAEQHNKFRPERIHASHNPPHPRRVDVRPTDMRVTQHGDGQRCTVPLLAHQIEAAHHQHLRLDEPRIDVKRVSRAKQRNHCKEHPALAPAEFTPPPEQPKTRECQQRQSDGSAGRGWEQLRVKEIWHRRSH
jgi:iron(III) transport system ATP-binding protein